MDKQGMLKGIQDGEERLLFAKVLDQISYATKEYTPAFTEFMDAAKCGRFLERLQRVSGQLTILAYGGVAQSERMMLGFAPEVIPFSYEDFPITALCITIKNKKFGQSDLSHRDYLGSILGLGIERSKLGDIVLTEDDAICFVARELADYILVSLDKVSRTNVSVSLAEKTELSVSKRTEKCRFTVASMRLDAIVGEALRLSRGKAQTLITGEKVQVNWSVATNNAQLLKEGDLVSCRGFGRFLIGEMGGRTKKDRIALEVERYI